MNSAGLILSGNNTFTGPTVVNSGIVLLKNPNANASGTSSVSGNLYILNGATVVSNGQDGGTTGICYSNQLLNSTNVYVYGTGGLQLTSNSTSERNRDRS